MSNWQEHDASAFDENLAFRLSRLMSDSKRSSTMTDSKGESGSLKFRTRQISDAEGLSNSVEKHQQQRPASAIGGRSLSRPSLVAAATRVMDEEKKSKDVAVPVLDRSAMRAKLQSALRHPPQLQAVLKGLSHLFISLNARAASLDAIDAPVSYTHLTLPTILRV